MPKTQRMSGKVLQRAIVDLAHTYQWRAAHFASVPVTKGKRTYWMTPVAADGRGWP